MQAQPTSTLAETHPEADPVDLMRAEDEGMIPFDPPSPLDIPRLHPGLEADIAAPAFAGRVGASIALVAALVATMLASAVVAQATSSYESLSLRVDAALHQTFHAAVEARCRPTSQGAECQVQIASRPR